MEEALDSPSPYLGLSENLYYFGPLNYYQLSGDKFVHTVIHNEYDMSFAECRSLQSAFDTALQNSRTQKDTEVLALMQTNLNSRASVNRLQSHFQHVQQISIFQTTNISKMQFILQTRITPVDIQQRV